jgi:hypothetical protein
VNAHEAGFHSGYWSIVDKLIIIFNLTGISGSLYKCIHVYENFIREDIDGEFSSKSRFTAQGVS